MGKVNQPRTSETYKDSGSRNEFADLPLFFVVPARDLIPGFAPAVRLQSDGFGAFLSA